MDVNAIERHGDIGCDENLAEKVAEMLVERKLTVAVAESCTGGLLAKTLTDIPGASVFFPGSVVAYSSDAKVTLLGIDPVLIDEMGAVSSEVAVAMADSVRALLDADIGVAITGVAGPAADASGLAPGVVYIALSAPEGTICDKLDLPGDRESVRTASVSHALELILKGL